MSQRASSTIGGRPEDSPELWVVAGRGGMGIAELERAGAKLL